MISSPSSPARTHDIPPSSLRRIPSDVPHQNVSAETSPARHVGRTPSRSVFDRSTDPSAGSTISTSSRVATRIRMPANVRRAGGSVNRVVRSARPTPRLAPRLSEKRPNPNLRAILRSFGPRFSSLSPPICGVHVKILVCIKQVPERDARLRIAPDGKSVDTAGVATEINESDQYALEASLRLAEKVGGEVVALLLGPDAAEEAIRRALAMGATRAIHLNDAAFQGGDASATAKALAAAARQESPDLVLTGLQSDDAGWSQTGVIVAELLGWPSATLIMEIEQPEGGRIKVKRELESGWFQWITLPLPAVLTIQSGIYPVRYATLKGIMGAKKKEMKKMGPADVAIDAGQVGAAGRKVELKRLYVPEKTAEAEILEGDAATATASLVDRLQKEAKVL